MKNRSLAFLSLISWLSLSSLLFSGFVSPEGDTPEDASLPSSVVISLRDITCQSCGASVVKLLQRKRGVEAAEFDRDSAEIVVSYDPSSIEPEDLTTAIREAGYDSVVGAGRGSYAAAQEFAPGLDVEWISRAGEEVDIEAHLVPGKVTVFDFSAVWCGPCREVDEAMHTILESSSTVALRKINVVDWSSPVAQEYLQKVGGLPYVVVYATNGRRVEAIEGLNLKRLRRAIEKGHK